MELRAETLNSRIFFNESLNKAMAHAKRRNQILAILSLNLDDHTSEDSLLKEIESKLSNILRADDILVRLDDDFFILLNDIGKPKYASAVAQKLLNVCKVNIGICVYPNDGDSLEVLLSNVNTALDAVKHNGGGYQFYSKEMDVEGHEYIKLIEALRHASQNNELVLHYQPRHHIKLGHITGLETLLRWSHPQFGYVNPSVFIPLAEETNLIVSIGEWALYEACKMNKYWQNEGYGHITIGVNLSPKQFYHPDITNMISNVLKDTGLNPKYLEFEITESTVMNNIEIAADILNNIRSTGAQIVLDHFGVGATAISHLKQFPISAIKIDKSFIKGIPNNPNDIAITNAFIALTHNFGLEVVAEGVETAEQVQYLSAHDCDMVQGYFFSYPLPAQKIIQQFKKLMDEVF